jgi:hypothetical protein
VVAVCCTYCRESTAVEKKVKLEARINFLERWIKNLPGAKGKKGI